MNKRRSGALLTGLILGITLGWWLSTRWRRWAALHPPEEIPPQAPAKHAARRTLSALAVLLVALVVLTALLLGLTQTSWSISRGIRLQPGTLKQIREVRDGLAAEDISPAAVQWLDQALRASVDGTDVFFYAKAALQALEKMGEDPKVRGYSQRLRWIVSTLEHGRRSGLQRPTPPTYPLPIPKR